MDMTLIWGIDLATIAINGGTLDVWYPRPHPGTMAPGEDADLLETLTAIQGRGDAQQVRTTVITCKADLSDQPQSTAGIYLRLHPLSHHLVKPNTTNLDGIVSRLPNVVQTTQGPCATGGFEETRLRLHAALGHPVVALSVDRFLVMVHYVVPEGARITDDTKVRLSAYPAEGTSVMHAAFVNYNASTLGCCTVEGRISQGVVVDDGSDVGDGTLTVGTFSGDGHSRVRLGKRYLLGANSSLGIPLGSGCVVEAGLFLIAGAKITVMKAGGAVPGAHGLFAEPPCVPARTLADASSVLFRHNSQSGWIETLSRGGKNIEIPEDAGPHI